jgi:hypothetical protein
MKAGPEPRNSRPRPGDYAVTAVAAWLVPGAGHWMLGYRVRGSIIAVTLLGAFWLGQSVLAENMAVSHKVHPIFFTLQAGNGLSALAAGYFWHQPKYPNETKAIDRALPPHLNLGILFCCLSGLLNLLVVLQLLDPRTWPAQRDLDGSQQARPPRRRES